MRLSLWRAGSRNSNARPAARDALGHRLPADLAAGQILWTWHHGPPLVGRVNAMSVSKGVASNMSCPSCCECPSTVSVSLVPASSVGAVGTGFQEEPWEIDSNNCGTRSFPVPASWLTWWSSNSTVASVNTGWVGCTSPGMATIFGSGPCCGTDINPDADPETDGCFVCGPTFPPEEGSADVTVTPRIDSISPSRGLIGTTVSVTINGSEFGTSPTVNAGTGIMVTINSKSDTQIQASFEISATAPAGNHSVTVTADGQTSNSVNFFVQVPTFFTALNAVSVLNTTCSASSGFFADVSYQVTDQLGNTITVGGLTPQEHFTVNGVAAFPGFKPFAFPQTTRNDGSFDDVPVGSCLSPPPPNHCVDVVQTFNIVVPGSSGATTTYSINTTTTRRDCQQGIRIQVSPGTTFTLGTVN